MAKRARRKTKREGRSAELPYRSRLQSAQISRADFSRTTVASSYGRAFISKTKMANFRFITYRVVLCGLILSPVVKHARAQNADLSFLQTRAERSDFEETTRYDELMGFVEVAASQHPLMHLTTFGYTTEGRALPLVVYGDVADASPRAVRSPERLRVYVQGNIHAGEVCGKEAMLMLIRSLASGGHQEWADSLVILIAPIYNADGNERVSLFNRGRQNGPFGGMGQRPNAQDFDLNRDHMKARSPEARSLIRLMNEYDPHVLIDLHTTNGTRHAYHVTYSPPLNPNTEEGIDALLREDLLPAVTDEIRRKYGWEYYYYGNLPYRRNAEPGWFTFDHRPRFNNNYVGLRNRIAILSEAYSYATFRERVLASRYFVEEILNFAMRNRSLLEETVRRADEESVIGDSLALRAVHRRSEDKVEILVGEVRTIQNPYTGADVFDRLDTREPVSMYEYGTFEASETERAPATYYVDANALPVIQSLDTHGIEYAVAAFDSEMPLESFVIDSTSVAPRQFQGVQERTVFGSWTSASGSVSQGTVVVSMSQPLARLAFYLLEPRSDDGLVDWALLDRMISVGDAYPIRRSVN